MPELDQVVVPEKRGFISQPNSNQARIQRDEEELAALMAGRNAEAEEDDDAPDAVVEGAAELEPEGAEEKTFKKRYGDLRRHSQKLEREYTQKLADMQAQLDTVTKEGIQLPASDADIESWMAKYPEVAAIVESIALTKAKEQSASLESRLEAITQKEEDTERQRAETILMQLHPDFAEIRDDDAFHTWADEQPAWVQKALYEDDKDARSAARAIDLYKIDKGISDKPNKKRKQSADDAAAFVNSKTARNSPQSDQTNSIRESDVERMSMDEYEKNVDEITLAIQEGRFIYDLKKS